MQSKQLLLDRVQFTSSRNLLHNLADNESYSEYVDPEMVLSIESEVYINHQQLNLPPAPK